MKLITLGFNHVGFSWEQQGSRQYLHCARQHPARLASRFLNFLLSPADCRRNRSQPFRLRISGAGTLSLPLQNSIPLFGILYFPFEPKHTQLDMLNRRFSKPFTNLPLRRHRLRPTFVSFLGQSSISDDVISSPVCMFSPTAFNIYQPRDVHETADGSIC